MSHIYSMAYLSANGLPPVQAVELAAELGFDRISFRLLPAGVGDNPPPLMEDDHLLAETCLALQNNGVEVADIEMIRLNEYFNPEDFHPFLARSSILGARHILVAGDDTHRPRITDNYARLCALVAEYGLTADLEFMPWTAIKNIQDARELVEAAAHPAAAILFDCLHFDRSDSTLEDIAAIPRGFLNYIQICDGPIPYDPAGEAMMVLGRTARMIPGEGGIDLKAILSHLPQDIPVSVEVPNVALTQKYGQKQLMEKAFSASKNILSASASCLNSSL